MQPTQQLLANMLTGVTVAATGAFSPTLCFVGIAQDIAEQSPTSKTTWANVVPCTGSLSLGSTLGPLLGPYPLNDGSEVLEGEQIRFTPSTSLDNQTAQYWWLANAAFGGTLLAYEALPTAFPLVAGGDPLTIIPRLSITPTALGSVSQVYDG